jgi:hypothetical protein
MAAYQFDVIPSASRLVRGRLVVEQIQPAGMPARVKWAYVEPAESAQVKARGTGSWDSDGRRLGLRTGFSENWGALAGFAREGAQPGAICCLALRDAGQHRAALTSVEAVDLETMIEQGAVRPRTESQIGIVLNRTAIFTGPERRPALCW